MATATRSYPIGLRVTVYRDHAAWDQHNRWFLVPDRILDDLFVCRYELKPAADNPELPANPVRDIEWIEAQHPGCVFVY